MAARAQRDQTLEEFDAWAAAERNTEAAREIAGEEGGPRVSLVPVPDSLPPELPPDLVALPPPARNEAADGAGDDAAALAFAAEPSRNACGWSAHRQRLFIDMLAQSGTVHLAARTAGLSARAAYALRVRSRPFAEAWDKAQQLAVGRLSALAFDRAIHGRVEQVYEDGVLVGERRVPSERLLMWLLARLDPARFALPWERRHGDCADPQADARAGFPALLEALEDTPDD
ncbi:MAG: hypothetical protein ABIP91_05700 [Sphingomicrobium sp.]